MQTAKRVRLVVNPATRTPLLTVSGLSVHYGAICALHEVSFDLNPGEIVTLIGANGAGKSTTLRAISGLVRSSAGGIAFAGQETTSLPAHRVAGLGIAHVPEGRRPFANLTVRENLRLGAYLVKDRRRIDDSLERSFKSFPRLKERLNQPAGTLSGGELQMLAMARGLMAQPKLLLLDEPSMGLSPLLVREIFSIIREINREGTTVLLVEQNAFMALSIAHRAYVLETGRVVLSGPAGQLRDDPKVKSAYLGESPA
jgi:branched-chain amino acid transport system ATP-binding protein